MLNTNEIKAIDSFWKVLSHETRIEFLGKVSKKIDADSQLQLQVLLNGKSWLTKGNEPRDTLEFIHVLYNGLKKRTKHQLEYDVEFQSDKKYVDVYEPLPIETIDSIYKALKTARKEIPDEAATINYHTLRFAALCNDDRFINLLPGGSKKISNNWISEFCKEMIFFGSFELIDKFEDNRLNGLIRIEDLLKENQ